MDIAEHGTLVRASAPRRDHKILAGFLIALLVLAPLPLAGNRPILWALWTTAAGLISAGYAVHLLRARRDLSVSLRQLMGPLCVFGAVCGWLVVQTVPFASVLGLGRVDLGVVSLDSPRVSLAPGQTQLMLIRWLGYGLTFVLVAQVSALRLRALAVLNALYIASIVYAVLGIAFLGFFGDTLFGLDKWAYQGMATATFVNRNSYATYLAFGFAMGTALLIGRLSSEENRARLSRGTIALHLAGQAVLLAALLLSGSRMGLLAALIGGLVVMVLAIGAGEKTGRRALWPLLLAGVAGLLLLLLFGGRLVERLSGFENDAEDRLELYRQVWGMIVTRPWTGFGGGSFEQAFQLFHAPPLSADVVWDKAHSSYLTLAAELGIPMALLIIGAIAASGANAFNLLRDRSVGMRVPLAVCGVVVVAAVHSLVDFSLEIQANAYLFVAILGMGFGYGQYQKRHGSGA